MPYLPIFQHTYRFSKRRATSKLAPRLRVEANIESICRNRRTSSREIHPREAAIVVLRSGIIWGYAITSLALRLGDPLFEPAYAVILRAALISVRRECSLMRGKSLNRVRFDRGRTGARDYYAVEELGLSVGFARLFRFDGRFTTKSSSTRRVAAAGTYALDHA